MRDIIYVADIVPNTIVDGEGFRTAIYLSGCDIRCPGCHNQSLWDMKRGRAMTADEVYQAVADGFTGVTFIGGEPMMQAERLILVAKKIKAETNKSIWIYSGHTYEEILVNALWYDLLKYCDVLVDGRYDERYKKPNLRFRGSENQRIIDVKKSIVQRSVTHWVDEFCSDIGGMAI